MEHLKMVKDMDYQKFKIKMVMEVYILKIILSEK